MERFRAFGVDRANVWHEGGLHRVVDGKELRIEPAPGGVLVEPLPNGDTPVVLTLLGAPFDLPAFYEFAQADPVLARLTRELAGFRPRSRLIHSRRSSARSPRSRSRFQAAFAIRSRLIERYGERVEHAWAFPSRERVSAVREDELFALGFSRRKAEYVIALAGSDLDFELLPALPDEEVRARIVAQRGLGEWSADWFLARHLARPRAWPCRRPRLAEGGLRVLRRGAGP